MTSSMSCSTSSTVTPAVADGGDPLHQVGPLGRRSCPPPARRAAAAAAPRPAPGRSRPGAAGRRAGWRPGWRHGRPGPPGRARPWPAPATSLLLGPLARKPQAADPRCPDCSWRWQPTSTFSSTLMLGKMRRFWNVRAMPSRAVVGRAAAWSLRCRRTSTRRADGFCSRLIDVEERRLARPVGTDEGGDAALVHVSETSFTAFRPPNAPTHPRPAGAGFAPGTVAPGGQVVRAATTALGLWRRSGARGDAAPPATAISVSHWSGCNPLSAPTAHSDRRRVLRPREKSPLDPGPLRGGEPAGDAAGQEDQQQDHDHRVRRRRCTAAGPGIVDHPGHDDGAHHATPHGRLAPDQHHDDRQHGGGEGERPGTDGAGHDRRTARRRCHR